MLDSLSANDALALVRNCPFPILIRDGNGRVTGCNASFVKLVGEQLAADLQGADSDLPISHPARMFLQDNKLIHWSNANDRQYQFQVFDLEISAGAPLNARFFVDVSRQLHLEQAYGKLNEKLQQHILTDPVTGLLNRRGIMLALEPQVARSRRYNSPISLIALQFDYGNRDDNLTIEIARLFKDQLRWADLIAYTEQQEFVLVLQETSAEDALKLVDKLQQQAHELADRLVVDGQLGCAYGITDWRKNDSAETLLKRVETALHQARTRDDTRPVAL